MVTGPSWRRRLAADPVATAVLAFLGIKLAVLGVNLPAFPTLRRVAGSAVPNGTLLVPMRNEAARLPAALPGMLVCGAARIVFLDDESTDGSAELVRSAAGSAPSGVRVEVVAGRPRPPGWVGKTWACHQLAEAATDDRLVFCDVDVMLAADAVPAVLAELERQEAQVFSVFCRQQVGGWGERLVVPLITDVLLCLLPFPLLRAPAPSAATAHGALLVIRRDAYQRLGGFEALRGELVEDVALARRTRRLGLRLGLALGGDVAGVRMYRSYAEVTTGLGRGLTEVAGSRAAVLAGLGWHLLAYTLPVLLGIRSRRWRVAAVLGIAERLLVEAKTGGRDWPAALLVSLSPLASIPVVRQAVRRRQTWKGRSYDLPSRRRRR
jgi:Glycosyl transferase family 21